MSKARELKKRYEAKDRELCHVLYVYLTFSLGSAFLRAGSSSPGDAASPHTRGVPGSHLNTAAESASPGGVAANATYLHTQWRRRRHKRQPGNPTPTTSVFGAVGAECCFLAGFFSHAPAYSDAKVATRDLRVWHGATENA